jgi:protease I
LVIVLVRVLIVAGDAVEAQELFYPYYRLREEGYDVEVAAPSKKTLYTVVHDFEPGIETYTEKSGYRFGWVKLSFEEVRPEEYDGLVIPGGRAPEYIRTSPHLKEIVKHFFDRNKPVAAICHGPLVLTAYGLVGGRKLTAYSVLKADIEGSGGAFLDQEVVVDENLVTSRAWPDLPAFMREFIKLLKK